MPTPILRHVRLMNRPRLRTGWLTATLLAWCCMMAPRASADDFFSLQVRPIFRQHCTGCHGGVKAAGGVSFVRRENAIGIGDSGEPTVAPGKPQQSELIRRIKTDDEDERMPPADHGRGLTAAEIGTLEQWIKNGAEWSEVWSLTELADPKVPDVENAEWPRQPLDNYVLRELERRGLTPAKQAGPSEWLRRATLDLTGLPPTIEEFTAFATQYAVDSQAAKIEVVDRLLQSPQFGERWATMWLDLARYSDTFGFEKDISRTIWPWRDWVIRAFNSDIPYDQFTIKQLAGDLLPSPTADDILATAFQRNTQNNTEGGTDDEEFRMAAVIDRVNTLWTTWQGTTFGCVRCHAHPYDPYPQRDYYRFAAYFNTSEDCDQNDDYPTWLVARDPTESEAANRLQIESQQLRHQLHTTGNAIAAKLNASWQPTIPTLAASTGGQLQVDSQGLVTADGTLPIGVKYTITVPVQVGTTALRLDILPDSSEPTHAPERGALLSKLTVTRIDSEGARHEMKLSDIVADYATGPHDPLDMLLFGHGGFGSYPVQWEARWCVFVLNEAVPADTTALELSMEHSTPSNSGFQACPLRKFSWQTSASPEWPTMAQSAERRALFDALKSTREALKKIAGVHVPVMVEQSESAQRITRVQVRGNRMVLDQAVEPGIPAVLTGEDNEKANDRLQMSKWLVGRSNPLAARTLANRLWSELFGLGLVETSEDLGTSGAEPTHPELLDYLAWHLRETNGWSIKQFLRSVMLSSTYGQTANAGSDRWQADPQNRQLARGPRVRLTAEMIRDQALLVSGKLSLKQFGPPVFPPQPEGIWNSVYNGESWKTSTGEDRYRRAIYTFQKRTSGYPGYLTFDAPTRDNCTARRIATNTPLQALVTLNDAAMIELSQAMAQRMIAAAATPREQIAFGSQLLTLDAPQPSQVARLEQLYQTALNEFTTTDGTKPTGLLADDPATAAMTLVANTLLNLDASLMR